MAYPTSRLPFEELTTIDERVDFVHDQVAAVQLALNKLLEKEDMPTMAAITRDVNLRALVLRNTGTRISKPSPLTGRIVQLIPHWPDGTNALVDIAVGHRDTWIYPHQVDTYVALNDATPVLTIDEPIEKGEELWMVIRNADGGNDHAVSCAFTIVGVVG